MRVLSRSTGGIKVGSSIMICFFSWEESEERPHQVACYIVEDETRGLDLEERKKM